MGEIVGFCELWIGEQKYKSDGIKNAGFDPVWNQSFLFNLNGAENENQAHLVCIVLSLKTCRSFHSLQVASVICVASI
jgi:hypothetical protein